jgi:hypothetical protein
MQYENSITIPNSEKDAKDEKNIHFLLTLQPEESQIPP